jgi:hypothetical protein
MVYTKTAWLLIPKQAARSHGFFLIPLEEVLYKKPDPPELLESLRNPLYIGPPGTVLYGENRPRWIIFC